MWFINKLIASSDAFKYLSERIDKLENQVECPHNEEDIVFYFFKDRFGFLHCYKECKKCKLKLKEYPTNNGKSREYLFDLKEHLEKKITIEKEGIDSITSQIREIEKELSK